jgi:spermidine synthase
VYGALELGAAAGARGVPLWLRAGEAAGAALYDELRAEPLALGALRLAIALVATLPASLCLGASLPALGAAALRGAGELGRRGNLLYAANGIGAALGAALAAFWLTERIGVGAGYAAALLLHAAVGATALWRARGAGATRAEEAPRAHPPPPPGARALLPLAAFSGFGVFAAQVLLIQAFAQVVDQSVHAFGAVLVVLLLALALAALGVSALGSWRRADARTLLGASLAAAAVGLAAFPGLLSAATHGLRYVGSGDPWPGDAVEVLGTAALAAGPTLLALGLVFPSLLAVAAGGSAGSAGRPLGRLVAANTAGALAGALAAPFGLLPWLGPWAAFPALGLAYAACALALPDRRPGPRLARAAALALLGGAVLIATRPFAFPLAPSAAGERVLEARATPSGVVSVVEQAGERLIRLDGHYSLGGTAERVREERQGHIPLLLHPRARRVAFLGSATAITAGAATAHPVERIQLVEIAPGVSDAARRFFGPANRGVFADPRTRVALDDARNYLRTTGERFDVIVGDLFVPWQAGASSLWAAEHFAALRDRLADDGLFCQWLPLYQLDEASFLAIAATFLDAFPRAALFRGDFFGDFPIAALVGWRGAPARATDVSAAAARLAAAGESDRWIRDPVGFWSLYAGPLEGMAPRLADVPRNRDDDPRVEFLAARAHSGGALGVREPFVGFAWLRFLEAVAQDSPGPPDPLYPDLPEAGRMSVVGGLLFQMAGTLWVAGRQEEASESLEMASRRLPPALLAPSAPDPSAANLWPVAR